MAFSDILTEDIVSVKARVLFSILERYGIGGGWFGELINLAVIALSFIECRQKTKASRPRSPSSEAPPKTLTASPKLTRTANTPPSPHFFDSRRNTPFNKFYSHTNKPPQRRAPPRNIGGRPSRTSASNSWSRNSGLRIGKRLPLFSRDELTCSASIAGRKSSTPSSSKVQG